MAKSTDSLDGFPREYVQEVFVSFSMSAFAVCRAAEKVAQEHGYKVSWYVNRRVLYKTVVSAYYDIARYKQFHFSADNTKRSDGVKRAAYFTKWISKFRPIQCVFDDDMDEPEIDNAWVLMLNEHLAVEWGCFCLANDVGLGRLELAPKFRNHLLYELHFRELNTDGLLAVFQMLSETLKSKAATPFFEDAVASKPSQPKAGRRKAR